MRRNPAYLVGAWIGGCVRETWVAAILWSAGLAACAPASVAAADADGAFDATATIDTALSAPDDATSAADMAPDVVADAPKAVDAAPDVPADPECAAPVKSLAQASTQASAESHDPCTQAAQPLPTTQAILATELNCAGDLKLTLTAPAKVYDHWWPKEMQGTYTVTLPAAQVTNNAAKQYLLNFKSLHLDLGPDPNDTVCHVAIDTDLTFDAASGTLTLAQNLNSSCSHYVASRTLTMKVQADLTIASAEFTGSGYSMPCGNTGYGWYDHFTATW
jgi:hypothetical protein